MSLFVGTSGWAYREWKPRFYPQDLPQSRFLAHYSSALGACEINATFYRLQSEDTFSKWVEATPESFHFAVKAHRVLTHSRQLAPTGSRRQFLDRFFASLRAFENRLGVVLFQFPPYRQRDDAALAALLDAVPSGIPYALEFRHASWQEDELKARIADRGTTVLSDVTGEVPQALPPGPIAYVRLRAARYEPEARKAWRELLQTEAQRRDVYAFAKHEGVAAGDPFTGVGLAMWLNAQTRE